jgi:hypothetical protein
MSFEEVRKINEDWEELFFKAIYDLDDLPSYWNYEPFSEGYWNEKTKIVLCNEEAYGDSRESCELTLEKFKERIKNHKDATTLMRSALFLYCLYKKLHNINITKKQLRDLYNNKNELFDGIRNTTYMNLRKEEKWKKGAKEDTDGLCRSLCHDFKYDERDKDGKNNEFNRKLTLEFIDALEPNIFIITGVTGLKVLKDIYKDKIDILNSLQMNGMCKTEKTLYVSMEHPSRFFSYNYILKMTGKIYEELQKQPKQYEKAGIIGNCFYAYF